MKSVLVSRAIWRPVV